MRKKILFLAIILLFLPFISCDNYLKRVYEKLIQIVVITDCNEYKIGIITDCNEYRL